MFQKKKPSKELHNNHEIKDNRKKRYISLEERKQIIEELRLAPKR